MDNRLPPVPRRRDPLSIALVSAFVFVGVVMVAGVLT
jgi:hypothetical protein